MELTAEQFAEIVETVQRGGGRESGRDKRRAPRAEQAATVVITPVAGTPARPMPQRAISVTVRNVSSRGLAILLNQHLPKGDQFVLRMNRVAGQNGPVSLLCSVAHCRRINANLFLVGAEFACVINPNDPAACDDAMERHRISNAILQ